MNYQIPEHIIREPTRGRTLESRWPKTIPVVYNRNVVGIAQFDGARYIYSLVGELEEKRNSGAIDALIEFEAVARPTPKNVNLRIARVRLFDSHFPEV